MSVDIKLARKHAKILGQMVKGVEYNQTIGFSTSMGCAITGNHACCAGMGYWRNGVPIYEGGERTGYTKRDLRAKEGLNALLTYPHQQEGAKGYFTPFLNWLVKESVISHIFPVKNLRWIKNNALIIDPDCNYLEVHMGVVALRALTEHTDMLPVWYALYRRGVKGELAFTIAHFCSGKHDILEHTRHHCPLTYNLDNVSDEQVKRFLLGDVNKARSFKEYLNYGQTSTMYGDSAGGFSTRLRDYKPSYKKPKVVKSKNPFSKPKGPHREIAFNKSMSDLAAILLPIQEEFLKEKV